MAIYIGHGNNADNFRYKKIFFKNILRFSNTPLYIGHGNNAKTKHKQHYFKGDL